MVDFSNEGTDFSGLYRDEAAPKDTVPSEELFKQLTAAAAPAPAPTPAAPAAPAPAPAAPAPAAPAAPAPAAGASPAPNPNSTLNPAADTAALLARLAPLGIKSMAQLKGKSDVELRKLSTDAVGYEQRQRDLQKHFFRNPDGSWDFSKGPSGQPTGLDPTGKVLPPAGTVAPAPAPTPGAAAKAKSSPTGAKRADPARKKPAAAPKTTSKAPTVKAKSSAAKKRPAKKPVKRPVKRPTAVSKPRIVARPSVQRTARAL